MEPKIIKTEEEYQEAFNRIELLAATDPEPGTVEGDSLELLAMLVESYEKKHYALPDPDPIDAIRFRMEEQGLKQRDLIPFIGSRSRVSEVLSRKRGLSIAMIRALNEGLGIPAEILVRKSRLIPPAATATRRSPSAPSRRGAGRGR